MRKPKKSSIKSEMEGELFSPTPISIQPSPSPETLQFMRESEAREWIRRIKDKIGEQGLESGLSWWERTKRDIARVRGENGLRSLLETMEAERAKSRVGLPGVGVVSKSEQGQALGDTAQSEDPGQGNSLLADQNVSQAQSAIGGGGIDDHV